MSDPKCSRWVVGALAAAALALVVVVSSTVPASAHDQIRSTTPADGQQVVAAPTEVSLVFTEDVLSLGAVVVVADSTGKDWADGSVLLDGTEATQTLEKGMPDGAYQVRWRVVSADGHPVSGSFTFAVGTRAPADSARPTSTAAPTATPVADAAVNADAAAGSDGGIPIPVVGLIGALIGIGVFALAAFLARKRTNGRL